MGTSRHGYGITVVQVLAVFPMAGAAVIYGHIHISEYYTFRSRLYFGAVKNAAGSLFDRVDIECASGGDIDIVQLVSLYRRFLIAKDRIADDVDSREIFAIHEWCKGYCCGLAGGVLPCAGAHQRADIVVTRLLFQEVGQRVVAVDNEGEYQAVDHRHPRPSYFFETAIGHFNAFCSHNFSI
jgi:hypothetical protein